MNAESQQTTTKRLLVVDDDVATVRLHEVVLRPVASEIVTATGAADALQLLSTQRFDVLVTDMAMGKANDGLVLASVYRRLHPSGSVIVVTGSADFQEALHSFQTEVDAVISKNAPTEMLVKAVAEQVVRAAAPGRLSLAELIRQNSEHLIDLWVERVEADPTIARIALPRTERIDHIPKLLEAITFRIEERGDHLEYEATLARQHGALRRRQGYTLAGQVREPIHLRMLILELAQQNVFALDLKGFWNQLVLLNNALDDDIMHTMQGAAEETGGADS